MKRELPGQSREFRRQYVVFAATSACALGLTAALLPSHASVFAPYFLGMGPIPVMALTGVAGLLALAALLPMGFAVWAPGKPWHRLLVAMAWGSVLVVPTILVDTWAGFPEQINVAVPESLLFYPAIGYLVEVLFHAVPLAVVMLALPERLHVGSGGVFWVCAACVAAFEPLFQVWCASSGPVLSGMSLYLGIHLYLFNLLQLRLFRSHDFLTMFTMRLAYYLCWHILWGTLRLQLLF